MSDMDYFPDNFTLAEDFTERTDTTVGPDEFSTVAEIDVPEGEAVILGRGSSRAPNRAEGSVAGNIQSTGNSDINGKFRFAVVNSQNNIVQRGRIAQGGIDAVEVTRTNALDGYFLPLVEKETREPYKVVLQLKTNSGTADFSAANSTLGVDGFRGESVN